MILPQSYSAVLFLMVLSVLCLGSWASAYKLAGKLRFELFYFDFAMGLMLAAVICAFTVGDLGFDGFNFLDDLQHAGKRQWIYGFSAGMVFNLGNMLLMAAVSVAGLTVAFPIGMGVALVIGTALGYATRQPGNVLVLTLGCALIVASIGLNAVAYRMFGVQRHEALARSGKAKSTRRPTSLKGIILALVSGLLLGCFMPLLDHARLGELGLGPYAIGFIFAFGVFFSTFMFNIFFINLPVEGDPVEISAYFAARRKQHLMGLLAGVVWCIGTIAALVVAGSPDTLQGAPTPRIFMAHAAPLLAGLWGLLIFREFKGADMRVKSLSALMLVLFACGLALIAIAPLYLNT